ncbi:MAG: cadmium resistance protein CadD (predicted permease) [Paracoccaceae bacterium]|jgi:cadmium resistance protein CadD (predicted permease)
MTLDYLMFALSAGLAQVLTNLDNLAVLFAMLLSVGALRAVAGYATAQILVLITAFGIAVGASDLITGDTGYLGLVPVGLGLYTLWKRHAAPPEAQTFAPASYVMATVMFLAMSFDTFAVMAPLLIDSAPVYRAAAMTGVLVAIALTALFALGLSRVAGQAGA